ncbi:MAG TPA: alpha/beta hydrolase [Ramlibacter sp.]|uniref:alpha/beta hydrolase n=1 Tax=Ramlibacter sp. TaxID=1917967 RepID=UPI002ED376A3
MSQSPGETTLSTFTASDGDNLAVQDWHLPEEVTPRATVLVVHGLGEHGHRYDAFARQLNGWGFAVRSYDQYGHGDSGGLRGGLPQSARLIDDLADLVEATRNRTPGIPLVLFGHSMGGVVAASFVARGMRPIDALVLSSPALATRLTPLQKLLMNVVPRVAPNLAVGNGLDPEFLSHDPQVVAAYRRDPRVHDRVTGRLARFIQDEGERVRAVAPQWNMPTLLLYAGDDRLVDPAGSREFADRAPKTVVTSTCFPEMWHEIFNERDAGAVYAELKQWLDTQF